LVITVTTHTALEGVAPLQVGRGESDQIIAVADRPFTVHREHAIAVPVEGEAEIGARGRDVGDQVLDVGRAAAGIDVAPVGLGGDRLDTGTESLEDRRCGAVGRAIGTVEGDGQAAEVEREGPAQLAQVVVQRALQLPNSTRALGRRRAVDQRLDLGLRGVVELRSPGREELDPVVAERVV